MKSRVYGGCELDGRQQLVEVITEGGVGIGNELQWQTAMGKVLAACKQCEGVDSEHVVP